ncbi:hypothetical protein ADIS_0502 [Lunatimonas lonarensis]|uniref:Uncharacterized protein n=1 Tax=Lunatimonas lonarensis TaxID=1232681 RepID=R7ZY28_9BACT|nr:hypothetical protein ADIS_0502 [Lunatimonas lonarensis]
MKPREYGRKVKKLPANNRTKTIRLAPLKITSQKYGRPFIVSIPQLGDFTIATEHKKSPYIRSQ